MSKIYQKLCAVQSALKAPKSQFNKFGNYAYRKAEDILEAVKPLLAAQGCVLNCTDELVLIGDRYYIKATATITAVEDGSQVSATAFAREEEEKKGMDGSQVTGASSSYARKYALNGLFCIDDTADSDTTNVGDKAAQSDKAPAKAPKTAAAAKKAPEGTAVKAAEKKPVPARHSEEWNNWVNAILTGWKSKTGKSAIQVFSTTYDATPDEMSDLIGCLEEDAFNAKMDGIAPENETATANA